MLFGQGKKDMFFCTKKIKINFKITLKEAHYLYFSNIRACQSSYRVKGQSVIYVEGTRGTDTDYTFWCVF